jgi:hypothetical protein
MRRNNNGNVLVYILVAIALLAALTYVISSDSRGNQTSQIDDARVKILASDLIRYVTTADMAVKQMTAFGTDFNQILFDLPSSGGFTTTPTLQVYHPRGGGLTVFQANPNYFDTVGTTGWQFQGNTNVGWSQTAATDLILSFINVNEQVCAQVNQQLYKDPTIPVTTVNFTDSFTEGGTDADFIAAECAACANRKSFCISDGTTRAFYSVIGSR